MPDIYVYILFCAAGLIVGGIVAGIIAFRVGVSHRKKIAENAIGSAEAEAKRILSDALNTAESKKKEILLEAKDEIYRQRQESERELKERRIDIQRQERRLQQKEETLDKKIENYEKKEEVIANKLKEVEAKLLDAENLKKGQFEMLERISGFTAEQAKEHLLSNLESELIHEKSLKISEIDAQCREEADQRARDLISHAIQRCAADQVTETTVSVVPLPNDEMKGRIIGREGRNIRAIETLTGVDLIIDDTPEAITLSGFDPVRREIARIALERLISDGRIHPARIEEMVEKARREVEATIKQEGERAVLETGLHGISPEIVKLLGRLHYRTSCGQNVLNHSMEVAFLSCYHGKRASIDPVVARRAGLIHDIGKAVDHEIEAHMLKSASTLQESTRKAKRLYIQSKPITAIEAKTVVACLVQAADAISAARPGARRENLENYIKSEKLEEIANEV